MRVGSGYAVQMPLMHETSYEPPMSSTCVSGHISFRPVTPSLHPASPPLHFNSLPDIELPPAVDEPSSCTSRRHSFVDLRTSRRHLSLPIDRSVFVPDIYDKVADMEDEEHFIFALEGLSTVGPYFEPEDMDDDLLLTDIFGEQALTPIANTEAIAAHGPVLFNVDLLRVPSAASTCTSTPQQMNFNTKGW
mmetsp:Transcript_55223/g.87565  ORF Transcript_55223/g.87565 Transcript_55223/m.87565 type:complete len:191 (+) Transcript_55223:60-632(+)